MISREEQLAFAKEVVRQLRDEGFQALWAGGCVRDRLLGNAAKDYDVATSAVPEEIRRVFGKRRTLPIGVAFGVITVLGPSGAGQIEVATFRQDAGYSDGRHPDSVTYSCAEEDAKRRDFTINGVFYDPIADQIIDFVGGQEDLQKGLVRAIGDAEARIAEDKLRMLRAVRFTARLRFELDESTRRAIEKMAGQLAVVSAERIAAELRMMLTNGERVRAVELLRETGLLAVVLPDSIAVNGETEAWEHTRSILSHLREPSFPVALSGLMLPLADEKQTLATCQKWKLSNHERERTCWLVRNYAALDEASGAYWPTIQRMLIHEGGSDLVSLLAARVQSGLADQASLRFCEQRLAWPDEQLNPRPVLTGDDLQQHGLPPGEAYKQLLSAVRDAQLLGEINSRAEGLRLVDQLVSDDKESSAS